MFDINNYIDSSVKDVSLKKKIDKNGKINLASNELLSKELLKIQKEYADVTKDKSLATNSYPYYPRKREEMAELLLVDQNKIEFFSGSDTAIYYLVASLSKKTDKLIVQSPNYENYFSYSKINGIETLPWKLDINEKKFHIETLEEIVELYSEENLGIVISNPNGFTGKLMGIEEIEYLAKMLNKSGSLLIIDLAYLLFSRQKKGEYIKIANTYSNVLLINTLSKSHGLAAARFGYIYGHPQYIEYIRQWNGINSISEATYDLVKYYLRNEFIFENIRGKVIRNRETIFNWSKANSKNNIFSSEANFLLIEHKDVAEKNKCIQEFFEEGFIIRDLKNIDGMERYSRLTIPADDYLNIFKKLI